MKKLFTVVDDFCPQIDAVRASALESGFGTWRPNKGEVGSSIYEGMSFWGRHSLMLHALARAINAAPFPNNMFFRVTNEATEQAYVHSDRMWGEQTCVAYVSQHDAESGTGFFRHRRTGLVSMPTFEQMRELGIFEELKEDMVSGGDDKWEQLDFVRGLYNRAVIFHAPLFHSRSPRHGIGTGAEDGRMVWVTHFNTFEGGIQNG
jgi:hypothetical protein